MLDLLISEKPKSANGPKWALTYLKHVQVRSFLHISREKRAVVMLVSF